MKEKIFNNWWLKILAVLLAFVVWFLVANLEDYTVTKTINGVPVRLLNEEAITSQDLVYEVTEGDTVNIEVKGRRSIVEHLTAEDFQATADLSELSITNSVLVTVEATATAVRREVEISIDDNTMKVAIEERAEKKIPIEVQTKGEVQDGYAVIATNASPNMITISGSESRVDAVESAVVSVDVDALNDDVYAKGEVVLLDANGEAIDTDHLSLSAKQARVTVTIQKTKEVPIEIRTNGDPAEGYAVSGEIEFEPSTVMIAGPIDELRGVDSIVVDDVDLTDVKTNMEITRDLSDYLPTAISIADTNKKVAIVIKIEPIKEREMEIRPSAIGFNGVNDGYSYKIENTAANTEYKVVLKGLEDRIGSLTVKEIAPAVDVSELTEEGTYTLTLQFAEIEGVEYADTISVKVLVKKTGEATEASSTTEATTADTTED